MDKRIYQNIAVAFCLLYALALILNTHPLGDGAWFWYATYFLKGRRLYADQHLALQPLFVLQTALSLKAFGPGWLVSKLPGLCETILYLFLICRIARRLELSDARKGLLITIAFCSGTLFAAYRATDYHLLADCFTLLSVLVLLYAMDRPDRPRRFLGIAALIGIVSGLALLTRLNDGAILLLTSVTIILLVTPNSRLLLALTSFAAAGLTVFIIVLATGDTLYTYLSYSVLHVAGNKGGIAPVLLGPFQFPLKTVKLLIGSRDLRKILIVGLICGAAISRLIVLKNSGRVSRDLFWTTITVGTLALIARIVFSGSKFDNFAIVLAGLWMLAAVSYSLIAITKALLVHVHFMPSANWNRHSLLLLIPLGQILSSTMSSAGVFFGIYAPVGMFLLLLPLAMPRFAQSGPRRSLLLITSAIMLACTVAYKVQVPFAWHSYIETPMFTHRTWFRHPLYGYMYIDTENLAHFRFICSQLEGSTNKDQLLSLPYPYANYFCGVAPWHGYSQTFFDTAAKNDVARLSSDLDASPPKWIVYQRQMNTLTLHETLFNGGQPLPQRQVDTQIMEHLANNSWKRILNWNSSETPTRISTDLAADWMFIKTK